MEQGARCGQQLTACGSCTPLSPSCVLPVAKALRPHSCSHGRNPWLEVGLPPVQTRVDPRGWVRGWACVCSFECAACTRVRAGWKGRGLGFQQPVGAGGGGTKPWSERVSGAKGSQSTFKDKHAHACPHTHILTRTPLTFTSAGTRFADLTASAGAAHAARSHRLLPSPRRRQPIGNSLHFSYIPNRHRRLLQTFIFESRPATSFRSAAAILKTA